MGIFRRRGGGGGAQDPRRALGARGEEEAARFLRRAGMEILGRNIKTRLGELDLVARDGGVLVFVEVKARRADAFAPPELSVTAAKQRKLVALAQAYLQELPEPLPPCRFDVVAVLLPDGGPPRIRHIRDAFTA